MDFTEIEVRLGNLKFMTEQPNVYCSCALGSYDEFFTHLEYVAFVLSGTNTVYPNMEPWQNTAAANTAWNNAQPNFGEWNGFIAQVINGGLGPMDDVELVIRAATPPGYFFDVAGIDSTLSRSNLGTDAWNPTTQELLEDNQGVRDLKYGNTINAYNQVSDDYFVELDGDILLDVGSPQNQLDFSIGPNPFSNVLHLKYDLTHSSQVKILIYDISGQLVLHSVEGLQQEGRQSISLAIPEGILRKGIYLVEIQSQFEKGIQKILSQ